MESLFKYCLRLGDNSLILGHRLGEYSSHGPFLEEDLALTNVALDHIGLAEALLKYAGEIEDKGRNEDKLAYRRPETEYYNVQLVEYPNQDFAFITVRQFFMDVYDYFLFEQLTNSADATLSGLASKTVKEVAYHLRRSSEWIIRLGDGTAESKERVQNAVDALWMYTGELFAADEVDKEMADLGIGADLEAVKANWDLRVNEIFSLATLSRPEDAYMATGGRKGYHTEHMGYILAEMQYLPNAYPDATW